ncbi:MAG: signal peptidase I [Rhabdochlamydiaceae bacterium]|nr:signal peptidase I [Rhabdochlamydiaceae bacterium]
MKRFFSSLPLKKATKLLISAFHLFERKKSKLSAEQKKLFEKELTTLQEIILNKESKSVKKQSKVVQNLAEKLLPKAPWEKAGSFILALAVALCLAFVIRQTLFEPYEIPTGSMRPTFKEHDRLVVSKTSFGINSPFRLRQMYFDPQLVQRSGTVVFSGEDMDIRDVDTRYFYLFPGKKQYVKRLIGKPGDTLYFYGGRIYGIDSNGLDISGQLQPSCLDRIEHIPFIQFEGKVLTPPQAVQGVYSPAVIYQMNEPVAKLSLNSAQQVSGEMLPILVDANKISPPPATYGDLWGIKNFGMGRLLTKQEILQYTKETLQGIPEGVLYLEITHNPNLQNSKVRRDIRGRMRPTLGLNTSVIPLNAQQIKTLFNSLYTARFVVKNGLAYRYGMPETSIQSPYLPKLSNVPDGTYEFYYGKAYKISFEGLCFELPPEHPLYELDPQRVQLLYNFGIEWDTRVMPPNNYGVMFPSRYVYFRDGALCVMGAPLFLPSDTSLQYFLHAELMKQDSSIDKSYVPFVDHGAPLNPDGSLNTAMVKQLGLAVPEKMYLVLGDNHAMSADSREFGFVPEQNLKGAPDCIFWPPGPRFGSPNQPAYPFMNFPRAIMWTVVAGAILAYTLYQKRRNKLPLL